MSNNSKTIYYSQDNSNIFSKAIILEDNDNKLLVINKFKLIKNLYARTKVKLYCKKLVKRIIFV